VVAFAVAIQAVYSYNLTFDASDMPANEPGQVRNSRIIQLMSAVRSTAHMALIVSSVSNNLCSYQ